MRPLLHATVSAGALEVNLSDALYRSFRIATTTLVTPSDRATLEDETDDFESPMLPVHEASDSAASPTPDSLPFAPYVFRNLTGLDLTFQQQADSAPRQLVPAFAPKVHVAPNGADVPFVYEEPALQSTRAGRAATIGLRMIQVTLHGASHAIPNLPVDSVSRRVRLSVRTLCCSTIVSHKCTSLQMCVARFGDHKVNLNWEVSLGETGKIVTLRSHTIVYNRTNTSIEVALIGRDRSVTVVGTVAGPGCMPIPIFLAPPPAIAVRPSFRKCPLYHNELIMKNSSVSFTVVLQTRLAIMTRAKRVNPFRPFVGPKRFRWSCNLPNGSDSRCRVT
jgi:hypothetical protein